MLHDFRSRCQSQPALWISWDYFLASVFLNRLDVRVVVCELVSDYCLAAGLGVALPAALAVNVVEPSPDLPLLMVLGGI